MSAEECELHQRCSSSTSSITEHEASSYLGAPSLPASPSGGPPPPLRVCASGVSGASLCAAGILLTSRLLPRLGLCSMVLFSGRRRSPVFPHCFLQRTRSSERGGPAPAHAPYAGAAAFRRPILPPRRLLYFGLRPPQPRLPGLLSGFLNSV